jgi:2-C-methyl-D-erythritol 2,4-cyclodiphosphate synthase
VASSIGIGYDVHRLVKGRKLFLGGVWIPHPLGLAGHSDGDGLIHALVDALLGALGEGDVGRLFPDTDPALKDVRSGELLKNVVARLSRKGFVIRNVDTVIVAEEPKLAPHTGKMKEALGPILGLAADRIGIKAKTNEGLGLVGRHKAIACWAVALIEKKAKRKR